MQMNFLGWVTSPSFHLQSRIYPPPPLILFERLLVCTIMVGDGEEVRGLRNTNCTSACSLKAHNEPR